MYMNEFYMIDILNKLLKYFLILNPSNSSFIKSC